MAANASHTEHLHDHPKYAEVQLLNQGTHGDVYLCRNKVTQELVAIKLIERGEKVNRYVLWEVLHLRCLRHPHIVEFIEVILTERHLCIVTEFVAGGDLRTLLAGHQRLQEHHARWFFQQIIIVLDYCHRRGICHRDVKLENLLVHYEANKPPLIKLCDFGLSKAIGSTVTPVGTPSYAAPEVVRAMPHGAAYDGRAVDVWCAGVALFFMLIGHKPFDSKQSVCQRGSNSSAPPPPLHAISQPSVYQRILTADYSIPEDVHLTASCRDLLARMLVPDPAKRASVGEVLRHPWVQVGLPPDALAMNDEPEGPSASEQSEEEIRRLYHEAQSLPAPGTLAPVNSFADSTDAVQLGAAASAAPVQSHCGGGGRGAGADEVVLIDAPHSMRYSEGWVVSRGTSEAGSAWVPTPDARSARDALDCQTPLPRWNGAGSSTWQGAADLLDGSGCQDDGWACMPQ